MRLVLVLSVALMILAARGGDAAAPRAAPAGVVVAIGGGGDVPEIVRRFVALAGGPDARILVAPLSTGAERPGEAMAQFFRDQGARDVAIWNPADAAEADRPERLAEIAAARGVYFGGGDQSRGMAKLRGTRALAALRDVVARGGVVGGSSAGAALLSRVMITGGDGEGPIAPGRSAAAEGLGVLEDFVVDQHFLARGRFLRLVHALLDRPGLRGLGVDERTAAVVYADRIEVLGAGQVVLVEPPEGVATRAVDGRALAAVSSLRFRVLVRGDVVPRR